MNVLLITGEISGDMYGAALADHLKEQSNTLSIYAFGGQALKKSADHFVYDVAHLSHIGLGFYGQKHKALSAFYHALTTLLQTTPFDKAILVDFQHHNFEIASKLQQAGIPIDTFITPNFWLWKDKKKAHRIAAYSSRIFTIFPQEYALYNAIHPNVHFLGHPLLDMTDISAQTTPLFSDPRPVISLFPGSRKQEFDLYLRTLLHSIQAFPDKDNYHIVLALSSPKFKQRIEKEVQKCGISLTLWEGDQVSLFKESKLSICASGTATLQAVICKTPLLILAALPPITYFVAKYIMRIKLPYVTLPNIVAEDQIAPELVQSDITVPAVVSSMATLLSTPQEVIENKYEFVLKKLRGQTTVLKTMSRLILDAF